MSNQKFIENIEKAEQAIREKKQSVKKGKMRQQYHFMAESGWINDPNGLIYFRGQYHLFYQFNPYEPVWGEMHWGHAVSDNLMDWSYLPIALAPSETYDTHERGGCFSGTSIENEGRLYLLYTGTSRGDAGFVQAQCLAESEDGITFHKYSENPVITVPEGYDACDFRDPKIWRHNGAFYLACGAKKNGYARLLLYRSEDLKSWEYISVMAESRGEWGEMWECPDFYTLSGTDILTFSPVGVGERKTVYMTGKMDYDTGKFSCLREGEIDWGFDYYAPQTMEDKNGRRIMFGWAGGWEWMPWWKSHGRSVKEGWCGFYGLPREVCLAEDGSLQFMPVKEVMQMRIKELLYLPETIVESRKCLALPESDIYELALKIDLKRTTMDTGLLRLCGRDNCYTDVILDLRNLELKVDRDHSDEESRGISRSILCPLNPETLDIHIFMDRCSVEVFANEGRNVHTCCIYPGEDQTENCLMSLDGDMVIRELRMWELGCGKD